MMAPFITAHTSTNTNVSEAFSIMLSKSHCADRTDQYEQSLHSAALELKYERSAHLIDILSKDEGIRKIRFDMHILEDDNEELRDLLAQEEDRSDSLEKLISQHLARAEDAEAQVQELDVELRAKEQELSTLKVCIVLAQLTPPHSRDSRQKRTLSEAQLQIPPSCSLKSWNSPTNYLP